MLESVLIPVWFRSKWLRRSWHVPACMWSGGKKDIASHSVLIICMISARHHSYELCEKRGGGLNTAAPHSRARFHKCSVKVVLPSKSTSPSPFKSTSLRMSSTSFRPTCITNKQTRSGDACAVLSRQDELSCLSLAQFLLVGPTVSSLHLGARLCLWLRLHLCQTENSTQ